MALRLVTRCYTVSQSFWNNYSHIRIQVGITGENGEYNASSQPGSVTIDGVTYSFSSSFNTANRYERFETTLYWSPVIKLEHNSSGWCPRVDVSATFDSGLSNGVLTRTESFWPSDIQRNSYLFITSTGVLGETQKIQVVRPENQYFSYLSFYNKLKCTCTGNNFTTTEWIVGDENTLTTNEDYSAENDRYITMEWTPSLMLGHHIPNDTNVSIVFTLYTYVVNNNSGDGEFLDPVTVTKTFTIPDHVEPTCELSIVDGSGHYSKYGAYIKGRSTFQVNIAAEGAYGSTIRSYYTTANNEYFYTSSFTTHPIVHTGESTIQTIVTDSRGRSVAISRPYPILEYSPPNVSSLKVDRCDSDGNTGASDTHLKVVFSAVTTPLNDLNECVYIVKYKKASESEDDYTTVTLTEYTNQYRVTNATYVFPADSSASYNVLIEVADDFGSRYRSTFGSSRSKLLSFLSRGAGVAIGKIAELVDHLDIGWPTRFRDSIYLDNAQRVYGTANDGSDVCMLHLDSSDNTAVTGSKITLTADDGIYINGRLHLIPNSTSGTSVLWTGEWFMKEAQTATLSELISTQVHGIALVWSYYSDATVHDTDFQITYIPKELIALREATETSVLLKSVSQGYMGSKRLIITDTAITGHSHNDRDAAESIAGYTDIPQKFVLRYVIGV